MKWIGILFVVVCLTGCAAQQTSVLGTIDAAEKTMVAPIGNGGLTGNLKKKLRADGWALFATSSDISVATQMGNKTFTRSGQTTARYHLIVDSVQYDYCFTLDPAIHYDVVLVDLKSGQEVLSISGKRECESKAAEKVYQIIKELVR